MIKIDNSAHRLDVDQILAIKNVSAVQLAPNADRVAFVLSDSFKSPDEPVHSRIWIVDIASRAVRQLTSGPRSDRNPQWSPDGKKLAFCSDRLDKGKHQLFTIDPDGGEAVRVVDTPMKIRGLDWSPDGNEIAFIMTDPESAEERRQKEQHDDAQVADANPKFDRLYRADLTLGQFFQVTCGPCQVWEYDWSPSGDRFVLLTASRPGDDGWFDAELSTVTARGGEPKQLIKTGKQFALPRWSPDGHKIAYISCTWSDPGLVGGDLFVIEPNTGQVQNVTAGQALSVSHFAWLPDSQRIRFLAHAQGDLNLIEVDVRSGQFQKYWSGAFTFSERNQPEFSTCRTGQTIAVAREDPIQPRDIWTWSIRSDWSQLTRLHPACEQVQWGSVSDVHWPSHDGRRIQGLLIRPAAASARGPHAMVVQVHGGPANIWPHRLFANWHDWGQLLAAHGYAVFLPNFRGSFGSGTEFTEANLGDMGGGDFQDIMTGIDYLVGQGVADPARLGICGWSYGGFMAAWAITQSDRFRAAIMGAGITNWHSFHGTAEIPSWDTLFWRDDPFDSHGRYSKFSPIAHVRKVRTPMLILHGADDCCVPATQSKEFYRALRDLKVPTELVLYPREGHSIQERNHQRDLLGRVVDWFNRWLPA